MTEDFGTGSWGLSRAWWTISTWNAGSGGMSTTCCATACWISYCCMTADTKRCMTQSPRAENYYYDEKLNVMVLEYVCRCGSRSQLVEEKLSMW
eukprot:9522951-Heterocapsa_arctica.AAC.1